MMSQQRFEIIMDPDAMKEYKKIDNSVVEIVDKALEELEIRADEVGKKLSNYKGTKLAGCKEIKLRDAGVRIVFRVIDEKVDVLRIVYILAVEKRSKDFAFNKAHKKYKILKGFSKSEIKEYCKKQIKPSTKEGFI